MNSSPPSSLQLPSLRPSEKVQHFFEEQLLEGRGKSGARLPTIKEIARHLDVGVSTVQAVFARLSSEGKVIMIPGKGTFLADEKPMGASASRAITVIIREHQLMGKESTWGKEICTSMLREAANHPEGKMTIHPFFPENQKNLRQLLEEEAQRTAGAIIFPDPIGPMLAEPFEAAGRPVVHITPSCPRATRDFVSPDFYGICQKIGAGWRRLGRKRLAVLVHMPLSESATCTLSLAGLQAGFQEDEAWNGGRLDYRSLDMDDLKVSEAMESIFRRKPFPDALYSTGDMIAAQAVEWLLARGIKVPEEVSIIGGTGLHPAHGALLPCTVIQQPFERMGEEAVRMLVNRLRFDNASLPGRYLEVSIRPGRTTTEAETRCFGDA
ncbi:MAG TPA: GntR family transcriptional regulator [Chthoniobacteraceae bacterium]|nr:GntR family transcriptional regulator [Chthoniobacteraceae bacterium]